MSSIKVVFAQLFEDFVTSNGLEAGTTWVPLATIHLEFMKTVADPIEITRHRLGRSLTGRFRKTLRGKPLQVGYFLNKDLGGDVDSQVVNG